MAVPETSHDGAVKGEPTQFPVTEAATHDITNHVANETTSINNQAIVSHHSQGGAKKEVERVTWSGKVQFLLYAIGFAVGLGNIWRFPHLCYRHGGGAFLIPYVIMLAVLGLPLFFLELAFGQYASLGPLTIWRICPLFKGLGYAMFMVNFLVAIYYNALIAFTLFYLFASFQSPVPWSKCDNWWNSHLCSESRKVNQTVNGTSAEVVALHTRSPAQEFWEYRVLGVTNITNIANIGDARWHVSLCLLLAWFVVLLCIVKGIKSSGKVVYFTATFPYVVLIILFIRGVTLEGAALGITYYLKPDFRKMAKVEVWKDAAIQILYSLGPGFGGLLTMGSFNKFNNNCQRDAIIVTLVNCGTSVFAGFVIFSVLGHMAHDAGVSVDNVVDKGPGLAFVAYPEGLAMMPGAPFWSICFFFMLFLLGLDSQFAGMECIITGLTDEFPILYRYKLTLTSSICMVMFLAGLPCTTQGGMYVIELLDKFSTSFPLLIVVLLEVVVINWIYGFKRFRRDIEVMIGHPPNYYWLGCWVVLTPVVIMFLLVFSCIQYDGLEFMGYHYPTWAEAIGWLLSMTSLLMIPVWMVVKLVQCVGSCQTLMLVLGRRLPISTLGLSSLIRPTHEWGPALLENRQQLNTQTYGRMAEEEEEDAASAIPEPPTLQYKGGECTVLGYPGDSYI